MFKIWSRFASNITARNAFFGFLALFMEVARRAIHIIGFYNFNLIQNIIAMNIRSFLLTLPQLTFQVFLHWIIVEEQLWIIVKEQ